jgi:hypothetical protein
MKRHRKEGTVGGSDTNSEAEADSDSSIPTKPSDNSRMLRHRVAIKGVTLQDVLTHLRNFVTGIACIHN